MIIKKRTRPQPRVRQTSPPVGEPQSEHEEEEEGLPLADLIELRKLRKGRQGIDVQKLNKGDVKRKKKRPRAEDKTDHGGLSKPKEVHSDEEEDDEEKDARARRVVRANNFTGQTNALDVDKHMMAYIEENLKIRSQPRDNDEDKDVQDDPHEALYKLADRWKVTKVENKRDGGEEGNVTNSLTMLTAIPEVDLGMDTRLKNIEDTEKAKGDMKKERQDRKKNNTDEDPLASSRFYQPSLRQKSDTDIIRDAKLEAMGLSPQDDDSPRRSHGERTQMATDELVMERFKKRMRK